MDEIASKAVIIGVSIFVTLLIVTVLIFEFTQIKDLYRASAETDITFEARLDEFDKYRDSNNIFYGLDVRNTIEKYKNDPTVKVCINVGGVETCNEPVCEEKGGVRICNSTLVINEQDYNKKYKPSFKEDGTIFKIVFEE